MEPQQSDENNHPQASEDDLSQVNTQLNVQLLSQSDSAASLSHLKTDSH